MTTKTKIDKPDAANGNGQIIDESKRNERQQVASWAEKTLSALRCLRQPAEYLGAPPNVKSFESVERLLEVRRAFRPDDASINLPKDVQDAITYSVKAGAEAIGEAAGDALVAIDRQIALAIEGLTSEQAHKLGVVRVSDFAGNVVSFNMTLPFPHVVFAGVIDGLPADHPLRSLGDGDTYAVVMAEDGQRKRAVILGPGEGKYVPARPRAWYPLGSVIGMTRAWRQPQVERERERVEQEREERKRALRDWWNSPLGTRVKELKEIGKMEQLGLIPPEVHEDPVLQVQRVEQS